MREKHVFRATETATQSYSAQLRVNSVQTEPSMSLGAQDLFFCYCRLNRRSDRSSPSFTRTHAHIRQPCLLCLCLHTTYHLHLVRELDECLASGRHPRLKKQKTKESSHNKKK